MMKNKQSFGPKVITHEENPKQKFLNDAIKKQGGIKQPDDYKVIVTERRIDHD